MFTVIICGNALLNKINTEHSHILDLLAHNPNCVICPWYPDKETFEEAVPGLNEITAGRTNWRALIIQDKDTFGSEIINKRNPFDVVDSLKALTDFGEKEIRAWRSTESEIKVSGHGSKASIRRHLRVNHVTAC